jgi:hypothetical protein
MGWKQKGNKQIVFGTRRSAGKQIATGVGIGLMICLLLYGLFAYGPWLDQWTVDSYLETLEQDYLYQRAFLKTDYEALKKEVDEPFLVSKKDFRDFVYAVRDLVDDPFLYFFYDDLTTRDYTRITGRKTGFVGQDSGDSPLIPEDTGVIRFGTFKEGLAEDTEKQLKAFVAEGKRALVLDLRNNGGGDLDEAERVADLLLRTNKEIYSVRYPQEAVTKFATKKVYGFERITVFVNENSASASELLALSLKVNLGDRVELIGPSTYGKGVGQLVYTNPVNHTRFYVVNFRWTVKNRDVDDLQEYLEPVTGELISEEDYWNARRPLPQEG